VVEDAEVGVRAARAAGARVAGVGLGSARHEVDVTITDVGDLFGRIGTDVA
jgi:sugar-phosphatase